MYTVNNSQTKIESSTIREFSGWIGNLLVHSGSTGLTPLVSFGAIRTPPVKRGKKKKRIEAVYYDRDYSSLQHISDPSPGHADLEPRPLHISIAIYEVSWQAWPSYRPHFCYFPKTYWKSQTYLVSWGHCSENEKMYDPLCGCIWTPTWTPSN